MKNRGKAIKWKEKTASRTALMALVIRAVALTFILGTQYALAGDPHWYTETVDSIGDVGHCICLALDSNGNPCISYWDDSNQDLKYARFNGLNWNIETVDTNVGAWTSLALDNSNNPHISYNDVVWPYDLLKYARYTGTYWNIETVDTAGGGYGTSIALDSYGRPHISYQDWGNRDLKYAWYNGTYWDIQTVESEGSVGWHSSIALDINDKPHISYWKGDPNYDLRYAHYDGGWDIKTVDSTGNVGSAFYTSIALGTDNNPHISYYDQTNADLKYAHFDGASWNVERVGDLLGGEGEYSSIALDSGNNPHISYYAWNPPGPTLRDLKYAYYDGSWHIETVESEGDVGWYTSIALDNDFNPHVSYYDIANGDLKYTFRQKFPPACVVSPRSLDFGYVTVGNIADIDFIITNEGEETLSGEVTESCQYFSLVGDVSYSLGAGESDTFTVRFNPLTDGEYHCMIQTGTDCDSLPCVGIGEYLPDCELSQTSLNFGTVTVGDSLDKSFSITNTGGGRLQGEIEESCPYFQLVTSTTYDLGGGYSKTFWVRFKPLSAGTKNCTIETGNPLCNDLPCTGIGEDPPDCFVTPTSLDFDTVAMGDYDEKQFTIRNNGGGTLSGVVSVSSDHFSIVGPTSYNLSQGQQKSFTVHFEPQSSGNFNCTVQTGEDCVNNVSCAGVGYFYFIHLTDPHVGTTGAYERYQFVINSINNLSPQPEFVVISGDLVHKGDRVDWWAGFYYTTQNLMVPYFLCVGNHDHYWYWPGEIPSFDPYFWDDEWQPTDNLHLISMNSGKDEDVWEWIGIYPLQYYWPADFLPEAEGLADSQITWLSQVIDDYPEYNKILFMHHPVFCTHSEWQFEGEDQTNGCITRNRDGLIDLLRDNAVKVVLGGHVHDEAYWYFLDTHDYLNSLGEPPNGRYWSSYSFCAGCLPMYVITRATGRYLRYRRIDVIGDEVRVWKDARFSHDKKLAEYHTDITYLFPGKQQQILTELNDTSSPGRLHVYDLDSNHVGFNHSSGVIDLEISMAYYEDETVLADTTDSLFWTPSEVISLFLEPEESYTYEIEIFMDCTLNVYGRFIEKNDAGEISTIYSDIPVSAGSVGKFFIDDEAVDHTLYIDDDGDGDFDRGIPPSDIVAPHDVGVSNVVLSDSVIQQGDSLTVHVYVENQGHYTETFDVIAYACGDMFFDPFWILNADMWSYYSDDVPRDSVSVSGGLLHVRGTILPFLDAGLTSITEFDYPITVETKLKSIYNYHCSPSLLFGTESNSCYIDLCYDTWDDGWRAEYTDTTGTHLVNWDGSISTETWYKLKLVIEEANFKAYLDDTLKVDRAWSPPDEYPKVVSLTSSCGMIGSGDFDWVKIQSKYDTKIGENTVVDLAPGESTIVSFKCSTKDITAGYYTLKSNIQPVQGETDLSDNTFTSSAVRITACGDCNADNNVDISDVVSIINYLFRDGSEPLPMLCLGDANGNGEVTIADVVYLVNYVLKSGTPPVNYCCAI